MQILSTNPLFEELPTGWMAIAGGVVAYARPIGVTDKQVVIASTQAAPTPVAGMKLDGALAFDGRMLATAYRDTVRLAALPAAKSRWRTATRSIQ